MAQVPRTGRGPRVFLLCLKLSRASVLTVMGAASNLRDFRSSLAFPQKGLYRQYWFLVAVVSTAARGVGRGQAKDLGGPGHVRKQMPHMYCCHDACNRVGCPSSQLRTSGKPGEGSWGAESEKPGPDPPHKAEMPPKAHLGCHVISGTPGRLCVCGYTPSEGEGLMECH